MRDIDDIRAGCEVATLESGEWGKVRQDILDLLDEIVDMQEEINSLEVNEECLVAQNWELKQDVIALRHALSHFRVEGWFDTDIETLRNVAQAVALKDRSKWDLLQKEVEGLKADLTVNDAEVERLRGWLWMRLGRWL